MSEWREISGNVTAAKGYKAAGITAGLKPSGAPDLALIVSDVPAIAAGVFTKSCVRAACVDFNRQVLQSGVKVKAILVNAGQANASTGEEGWRNAVECAELVQKALGIEEGVMVASTGVIGKQLRMDLMRPGIVKVAEALSAEGGDNAAKAIVTTDTVTKSIALEGTISGHTIRIGGICKGSGMIHPNMATMLAFVTCDAAVAPALWQDMVSRVADNSFNQVTVDGDTSTNDMLVALNNGQSGAPEITDAASPEAKQLEAMLTEVGVYLAKAIARDGEGATCLIEVTVSGASDQAAARQIAKTIVGSSLVKSAVFGRDPNWGRIAAAAGRSGVYFDQNKLNIHLGEFVMMADGSPQDYDRNAASNYLKNPTVQIAVSVGDGDGVGTAWGCDLSYDYVKINAEYTT
ncbi:bifunctional glutamate N-acetyltransferase/amino-acid acetyltransferase ArgJ [Tumidithrix elongata RA019]|uniref:Arginine biosynthesis bifunctional protein ArgJ n=1 Tax=Tumidithrix elongata BACA0141 TaxID=2716417 RepID=A0AAW9Q201_9CYAN|nr:bifunctional glutamate N-acetyltransferase/amino-acid acetyltransferase ArgJ [Tumidithrix elongata RA019]